MSRTTAKPSVPAVDSRAIRRRLEREDVLLTAPGVFDDAAASELLGRVTAEIGNANVVIDLHLVETCEAEVLPLLVEAAATLERAGLTFTLCRPSRAFDAAMGDRLGDAGVYVRRPRPRRPLRRSMRGQVGHV
jgi:anti-anti-sigma regulatory factor